MAFLPRGPAPEQSSAASPEAVLSSKGLLCKDSPWILVQSRELAFLQDWLAQEQEAQLEAPLALEREAQLEAPALEREGQLEAPALEAPALEASLQFVHCLSHTAHQGSAGLLNVGWSQ